MKLWKKTHYELWSFENEEEPELVRREKHFVEKKVISKEVRDGELENCLYRLFEVVDGEEPKVSWTKKKTIAKKAEDISEFKKAWTAVEERAGHLKEESADFDTFRNAVIKKFGVSEDGEGNQLPYVDVEIPDGVDTIKKALNVGFAHAIYKDFITQPGKATKMIDMLTELGTTTAEYIHAKAVTTMTGDKQKPKAKEPENKQKLEKEEVKEEDGSTTMKFKKVTEPEVKVDTSGSPQEFDSSETKVSNDVEKEIEEEKVSDDIDNEKVTEKEEEEVKEQNGT